MVIYLNKIKSSPTEITGFYPFIVLLSVKKILLGGGGGGGEKGFPPPPPPKNIRS